MQIKQRKAVCQVLFIELCKCLPGGLEVAGGACRLPSAEVSQRNPQRQTSWAPAGRGRPEAAPDPGTQVEKTPCFDAGKCPKFGSQDSWNGSQAVVYLFNNLTEKSVKEIG